MGIRWSPSTGHFYHDAIHTDLPDDSVAVGAKRHAELVAGRNHGRPIIMGAHGKPVFGPPAATVASLDNVVAAIKREARRRILSIASIEKQTNDNAALALGDRGSPLDRRRRIDSIRAASDAAEEKAASLSAAALSKFDATAAVLWPSGDAT